MKEKLKVFIVLVLFAACLLWSVGRLLASGTAVEMPTEYGLNYVASENIAVLASGVTHFTALSTANQARFREAHIQNAKGDAIRFRVDGTAPSTTIGSYLSAGTAVVIKDLNSFLKFQAITDSSGSGSSLFVTVYGK